MNDYKIRVSRQRSEISRQLLIRFFLSIIGFFSAFVFLYLLAIWFSQQFYWYRDDPVYQFLKAIWSATPIWGSIVLLLGFGLISYYFLSKPLRYLDEVVTAAAQLAQPTEQAIVLPEVMHSTQNELNRVREESLRNAAAAKEAEQRKNDLIVYLAHDLKTPLTSVIGYLTLLRDEPQISPALREKYTGIALDKSQRLEELINEFFEITRFNLTSLTLEEETVNLTRMLQQITSEFDPVLMEKNLTWNAELAPDVQIVCDPDKLQRVFDNLFRNAVYYSYPDTAICVSLTQDDENAIIEIENSGKTISPEKLSRMFEQFFRLDSSRASTTGGAGLGLAIAKQIAESHGGTIAVQSENESIQFTVTLPALCHKIV